ncbi:MAG TPA: hypothetical protein VKR06_45925 [Ktedonosporobacter sp.]|nr:hypothetical protein [Ktedonosporobacter sp.]
MAAHLPFTKVLTGMQYPTDHVVAALSERFEAARIAEELLHYGFAPQHIRLIPSEKAQNLFASYHNDHRLLKSLKEFIAQVASDEGDYYLAYEREAQHGDDLMAIYAPRPPLVDRACDVLKAHHAHAMKFFGRWTVSPLH